MRLALPIVAFALLLATTAAAAPVPEVALRLGRTMAVDSPRNFEFDQGGFSVGAGLLWPWEDRFRFGVTGFLVDIGSWNPTGSREEAHLDAFGAAWRVDALGPRLGRFGRGFATGSYGYYRFETDRRSVVLGARSAVGGTIGAGIERDTGAHAAALVIGATLLSDDFTRRFLSAHVEWRWRP